MVQLPQPSQMQTSGDPITCVTWLSQKDELQQVLCSGTGLGYLILWRQHTDTITEFDEVLFHRIGNGQKL